MSVKKLFASAIVLMSLAVTGMAQQPAPHPFLRFSIVPIPQTAPQGEQGDLPDLPDDVFENNSTGPAQPVPPAPPANNAVPAQPGQPQVLPAPRPVNPPAPKPPVVEEEKPANAPVEVITDPRLIQQLFFGGNAQKQPAGPVKPTPQMLEAVYSRVWNQVAQSYHDPVRLNNWHLYETKYKGKLNTEEDLEKALKDMLSSLNDPWTKYISTAELKKQHDNAAAGISDLGIWVVRQADGSYKVDYTTFGTPSYFSGLHKGDLLKAAGGKELKGLSQEEVEALLSGKDGSTIEVVYVRSGKEYTEKLKVTPGTPGEVDIDLFPGNIGYIRLPSFDEESFMFFVKGLQLLHQESKGNLNGLIFDLRGNSGGLVDLALQVASIFVEKGTVVTSTTRDGRMVTHQTYEVIAPQKFDFHGAPDEVANFIKDFYKVPLVVLVDGSSASSSEIVTGALKDSGRATIVGTTTYGKGVGYNKSRIPPGGILYITTMDYLTPSGYNLSNKGINPQVVVERTPGAKIDEQLVVAVEVLKSMPNPLNDPAKASKKQFGDGEWSSSPLVIAAAVAAFLLVGVLAFRHHQLQSRRRKEEDERDRDKQ